LGGEILFLDEEQGCHRREDQAQGGKWLAVCLGPRELGLLLGFRVRIPDSQLKGQSLGACGVSLGAKNDDALRGNHFRVSQDQSRLFLPQKLTFNIM